MLRNYLTTILRQIKKNKVFSFINISGLALGMAACLIIAQYVRFHTSFDQFHKNADKVFRIESKIYQDGKEIGDGIRTPDPSAPALLEASPFVTNVSRTWPYTWANSTMVLEGEGKQNNYEVTSIYFTEQSSFEIFDFPFLAGSAKRFEEKFTAILSFEMAEKMFNDPQEAIGKTFSLSNNNGSNAFEIVGVTSPIPQNSHIQFELLLSYPSVEKFSDGVGKWDYVSSVFSYILLEDEKNKQEVLSQFNTLFEENFDIENYTYNWEWSLRPLTQIHLTSLSGGDFTDGIDSTTITAFSAISIIILIIAWINYMNLSLVRTVERLKEMGVRMCMGSSKKQLTQLFITEAFVMNLIAFGLALLLIQISYPLVTSLTGLSEQTLMDFQVITILLVLIVLGTLIIGFYPSILLKSLRAINILTGVNGNLTGNRLRKSLVFVQFMITTFLLAGTYVVYSQINYMKNADLKINLENIMVLESPPESIQSGDRENTKKFRKLINALEKYPQVAEATMGGEVPGEPISWSRTLRLKNQAESSNIETRLISMDVNYPAFFGIDVVAGRTLREGDSPWEKGDVVINERLSEMLGFENPEDAVNQQIEGFYSPLTVRGVLENHHHTSLHSDYQPIAYIISGWVEYYFIKIKIPETTADEKAMLTQTIAHIKNEWEAVFTDYPLDYFFLDTYFNEQYKADEQFGKLFTGFSTLAIIIACLGLFGLTAFTIQQRTKEIGIRKVLGATLGNLIRLLSREYLLLVSIAAATTLPIAYLTMNKWLEDYTFRIDIDIWFVIFPVVLIVMLALVSVLSRVLGAATKNPVESLRTE
ncbi:MAG: ABC transporter permease [Bacteroidota bacterium]